MDKNQLANQLKEVTEAIQGTTSIQTTALSPKAAKEASYEGARFNDDNGVQGEEAFLKLTEKAAEAIKTITAAEGMPSNCRLRVKVIGGGCSGFSYDMSFDEKQIEGSGERQRLTPALAGDSVNPGDRLVESHGVQLIVDEMSLMYIVGTEIDYVEELTGTGFKFNNPGVKTTCGCGSSFSV